MLGEGPRGVPGYVEVGLVQELKRVKFRLAPCAESAEGNEIISMLIAALPSADGVHLGLNDLFEEIIVTAVR